MNDPLLPQGPSKYVTYDSTETEIIDGGLEELGPRFNQTHFGNSLGYRLQRRRTLQTRRMHITDVSFGLGLLGIILMVIDTELVLSRTIEPNSSASIAIRSFITFTSLCLLFSIIAYHITTQRLFKAGTGFEDWRLGMTVTKRFKICIELLVCLIHPMPFLNIYIPTVSTAYRHFVIPLNVILTILMFLRLYLLWRFLVLHNDTFYNSSVQSLGALSRVKIDTHFVFRSLISSHSYTFLVTVMTSTILINSWNMRLCEVYYNPDSKLSSYFESLWLTTVTFLTVGYGDVIPASLLGRIIALSSSLMGVGIMSVAVSTVIHELEQSRSEKYLHAFVEQIAIGKAVKDAASNVVKQSYKIFCLKRKGQYDNSTLLKLRRKLLVAKHAMHEAKFEQSYLSEKMVGTFELAADLKEVCRAIAIVKKDQKNMEQRVANLETLIVNVSYQLHDVRELLKSMK